MQDTPLIWTKRGNVPLDSVRQEAQWRQDGQMLMLHLAYFDKKTGELLSNSIHGYVLPKTIWQRIFGLFVEAKTIGLGGASIGAKQGAVQ